MCRQPAVVQFGQSDLVSGKGTMTMNLVVISLMKYATGFCLPFSDITKANGRLRFPDNFLMEP